MRTARPLAALAIAVAAVTLTACGGAAAQQSANVIVCQHYKVQRAYVKNLAEPTLADAIKFEGWIAVDAAQATPGTALARDLAAMSADEQHLTSSYDASARVLAACTAIGVKP